MALELFVPVSSTNKFYIPVSREYVYCVYTTMSFIQIVIKAQKEVKHCTYWLNFLLDFIYVQRGPCSTSVYSASLYIRHKADPGGGGLKLEKI